MAPPVDRIATAFLTTGALPAHEDRLRDLRALRIVNLPTRRRRHWHWVWAVFSAAAAGLAAYVAVTEKPLDWFLVVVFALSSAGWMVSTRDPEEAPEWAETTDEALQGTASVVLSGSGGLIDPAVGIATKVTGRLWQRLKPWRLARWEATIAAELEPGERRIASCWAWRVPHGWRRALWYLTLFATSPWLFSFGMLTVTDRRLILQRRSRRRLRLSAPLAELEVLEWYQGTQGEARTQVLQVRHGSRVVRFNISHAWDEEAQWVFDIVASFTPRPPAFLAARWVRWEARADRDLERQLGQAAPAAAAAVAG